MPRRRVPSEFKAVWLVAMFDLPVKTRKERRAYAQFRKALLGHGFTMLQFSVYARYFRSEERSRAQRRHIRDILPHEGHVRLVTITDKQFGKMEIYHGRKRQNPEPEPEQLQLF